MSNGGTLLLSQTVIVSGLRLRGGVAGAVAAHPLVIATTTAVVTDAVTIGVDEGVALTVAGAVAPWPPLPSVPRMSSIPSPSASTMAGKTRSL